MIGRAKREEKLAGACVCIRLIVLRSVNGPLDFSRKWSKPERSARFGNGIAIFDLECVPNVVGRIWNAAYTRDKKGVRLRLMAWREMA